MFRVQMREDKQISPVGFKPNLDKSSFAFSPIQREGRTIADLASSLHEESIHYRSSIDDCVLETPLLPSMIAETGYGHYSMPSLKPRSSIGYRKISRYTVPKRILLPDL